MYSQRRADHLDHSDRGAREEKLRPESRSNLITVFGAYRYFVEVKQDPIAGTFPVHRANTWMNNAHNHIRWSQHWVGEKICLVVVRIRYSVNLPVTLPISECTANAHAEMIAGIGLGMTEHMLALQSKCYLTEARRGHLKPFEKQKRRLYPRKIQFWSD